MTRCGTPSRAAIAAQSRLWRLISCSTARGSPSAGDALVEAGEVGRVDEPHAAAGRERVRRALHRRRLGRDPAEAVVALVADRDRRPPPSRPATLPRAAPGHAPGVESRLPCCGRGSGGGLTGPLWGERKERSVRKSYLLRARSCRHARGRRRDDRRRRAGELRRSPITSSSIRRARRSTRPGRRSRPPAARSCRRTPRSASRPCRTSNANFLGAVAARSRRSSRRDVKPARRLRRRRCRWPSPTSRRAPRSPSAAGGQRERGGRGQEEEPAARARRPRSRSPGLQWDMAMIHATAAGSYAKDQGDPGVLVGIIDTGVDGTHPDIAPNFELVAVAQLRHRHPGDRRPVRGRRAASTRSTRTTTATARTSPARSAPRSTASASPASRRR